MKLFKNNFGILCIGLFVLTRVYIWTNPPRDFSQITYVYMPYAHLWASGELPYLNQWYEYPPLTIPFFYVPHLIDASTNHHWYHLNYSDAYKAILTLVDIGVFVLIWMILKNRSTPKKIMYLSLVYYSLVTAKANHFIYDSFDILFVAAIVLGLAAPVLWKKRGTLVSWISVMAAFALKFVNAPLGLPLAITQRLVWKKLLIEVMIATILIWGLPVVLFRSSLLVTLEYHKQRGIQVESTAATIVRTIDQWTRSERFVEVSKAYDIQGPVSARVLPIFKLLFPLSLVAYIFYASFHLWNLPYEKTFIPMMWITLGYVALFMITAPVLSTPYLLWHIPLVAMLPTKMVSKKIALMIPSLVIIVAGMTFIPNVQFGPLLAHVWIGWIKAIAFAVIFGQVIVYIRTITGAAAKSHL